MVIFTTQEVSITDMETGQRQKQLPSRVQQKGEIIIVAI